MWHHKIYFFMGKGSKRRPEDKKKIDDNWDKIFKKKKDKKKK